jgi:hypothetical protein
LNSTDRPDPTRALQKFALSRARQIAIVVQEM